MLLGNACEPVKVGVERGRKEVAALLKVRAAQLRYIRDCCINLTRAGRRHKVNCTARRVRQFRIVYVVIGWPRQQRNDAQRTGLVKGNIIFAINEKVKVNGGFAASGCGLRKAIVLCCGHESPLLPKCYTISRSL